MEQAPEKNVLKLSDAFLQKEENYSLELAVTMVNINVGQNLELMDLCQTLKEYAAYVEKIRNYSKVKSIEEAVEQAVSESIEEGILQEFLIKWRAEAQEEISI